MSYPESVWVRLNDALDQRRDVSAAEAIASACAQVLTKEDDM